MANSNPCEALDTGSHSPSQELEVQGRGRSLCHIRSEPNTESDPHSHYTVEALLTHTPWSWSQGMGYDRVWLLGMFLKIGLKYSIKIQKKTCTTVECDNPAIKLIVMTLIICYQAPSDDLGYLLLHESNCSSTTVALP